MDVRPGEVKVLLGRINSGDQDAVTELIPLVYRELRRLAGHFLRKERMDHMVHEAHLSLAGQDRATWQNRAQFMAVAAKVIRRILLEYARRRHASKRKALDPGNPGLPSGRNWSEEIFAVDEALDRLGQLPPQQARIAEMRYFGGLSVEEAAEALRVSPRTVKRERAIGKAWLQAELSGGLE